LWEDKSVSPDFLRALRTSSTDCCWGIFLAIVFDQSRKPQFRCEECGTTFHSHTIVSRFFQLFWGWFVLSVIVIIAVIIWGITVDIWYR